MKKTLILLILCSVSFNLLAQDDYDEDSVDFLEPIAEPLFLTDRAPLFFKVGFAQRIFNPSTIDFEPEDAIFTSERSHSAGVIFGLDFGLNNPNDFGGLWSVTTTFGFTSYSLHYHGVFFADRFGFDQDAVTFGKLYSSAIEGAIELNYHKKLNRDLIGVLGLGFNVQQIFVGESNLEGFAIVEQGGESIQTLMFQLNRNNLFVPSDPPSHNLNLLWTVGIGKNFRRNQLFLAELRVCSSKTIDLVEELSSTFGSPGQLSIKKGYVGLDLSYSFAANQRNKKRLN